MGGPVPKQYLSLKGETILHWTLKHLSESGLIDGICLVVAEEKLGEIVPHNLVRWVVSGGKERQDSVAKGFATIPPCEIVLVHDAVRPFVSKPLLQRLIEEARKSGGAIPGLPVKETIKEVQDRQVYRTVDRSKLWAVQTPQVFRYKIFKEAMEHAEKDSFLGTDEAMLVERLKKPISLVDGSPFNIKITTPNDLHLAEVYFDANWNRL